VTVNGVARRSKDTVITGEQVVLVPEITKETSWQGQEIPLEIVFEDDSLLVVNKPPGLVVHPGAGNADGTLSNALLYHAPALSNIPRGGIIHRLDKETSGLLVVAKTLEAQKSLVEQLQARSMEREYQALVNGVMTAGGTVDAPIGRHPVQRTRQAVVPKGKPAVTHYRVIERFRAHTHVRLSLETGRTHQIRVHMAHIRYPIVGDPMYGGRFRLPAQCAPQFADQLQGFKRQALHAAKLGLVHPQSGDFLSWTAALPDDMERLITEARTDADEFASS
jgi:23S rRNA pseudouridine1911/1915/1917 synthase